MRRGGYREREGVRRRAQAGANAWRAVEVVMTDRRIFKRLKVMSTLCEKKKKKKKVWFYIALYPVHWTAQSALHFPPLADLFIPTQLSASLGSILAMQQLRNDYSLTFPPLSIARYSFIQLSRLRRREVKENAQTSKRYQRGFEPGPS